MKSHKPDPLPEQKPYEKAGAPPSGWAVTVKYHDEYATHPTPWTWTLWENGFRRDGGWAKTRDDCILRGETSKAAIIHARHGHNDHGTVLL